MFGIGHVLQYAPISLNLNALHFIPLSNTSITQQKSILHKVVFDIRLRSRTSVRSHQPQSQRLAFYPFIKNLHNTTKEHTS